MFIAKVILLNLLRDQPKTTLELFVEAIYGKDPPKRSADLGKAIDLTYNDLLNKKVDYQTVYNKCSENYESIIPYNTYDLAISTALTFFKNKANYGLDFTDQLQAKALLARWTQNNDCNPIIAKTLEYKLGQLYHIHTEIQRRDFTQAASKKVFTDVIYSENTDYFTLGKRILPYAPQTDEELTEVAGLVSQDIFKLIASPAHLYQFVMCEIENASMSDNEYAQKLVGFSGFQPSEYKNALSNSPLMAEENSAYQFLDDDIYETLISHYARDQAIAIRCLFMTRFINDHKVEIDIARQIYN